MDRPFLDANILFSTAYSPDSELSDLWSLENTELLASSLVVEEARRNLAVHSPSSIEKLNELLDAVTVLELESASQLPFDIELTEKDRHVLAAAIQARATHLLTGDRKHFGHLYGRAVSGVMIVRPADFLKQRRPPSG